MNKPYEPKPGNGTAFPNERKDNDKQPDLRGDFMDGNGVRWSIALWNSTMGRLSIKVEPYKAPQKREYAPQESHKPQPRPISNDAPFDGPDIPF